jgi:hypothetical protein
MPVGEPNYNADVEFDVRVRVPAALRVRVAAALTGNDDDIVLAAEKAMRERIDADGLEESIELAPDEWPDVLDHLDPLHERDMPRMETCGCGAQRLGDCAAAREGYFMSLTQRSDDELLSLAEGDGCEAALTLHTWRRHRDSAESFPGEGR